MVANKYNYKIENNTVNEYLNKLKNQIFKLLPLREEEGEWVKFLETIMVELQGLDSIFMNQINFISLIGKLEYLGQLEEFHIYRKTIFECINLVDTLKVGE